MTAVAIAEKGQNGKRLHGFKPRESIGKSSEIDLHTTIPIPSSLLEDDFGQIAFVSGFRRIDGNQNRIEVESLEAPPGNERIVMACHTINRTSPLSFASTKLPAPRGAEDLVHFFLCPHVVNLHRSRWSVFMFLSVS